jgi:hypothetical protein
MLSKTIETLKYLLLEYCFYFLCITLLLILNIYNHNKTLVLEKELVIINKDGILFFVIYQLFFLI